VCYFALGDAEKLKLAFTQLLAIPIQGMAEEDNDEDEAKAADAAEATGEKARDGLRAELKERQKLAHRYISTAAKVCAPVLDKKDWVKGFDLVIESLKPDHESIASEMEVCKAHEYLKRKEFDKAIEVLRGFEKKDVQLKAMASTNLSFLYFLEGDYQQANKYADLAVRHDRYNAKALVNKGNCLYMRQEFERAKEMYLEAIGVEADCVEAIFNLGIVNKRMDVNNEAQQAFEKLHSIIPNNPEVIYQIANLYDQIGNPRLAAKWFNILYTRVPTDPGVLSRLGAIFNKDDDEAQAFHYHYESYRYFPVNLDVISWLGVFYVKSELYEKAIQFFDRASQIQPNEVKWKLMVTGCYRRMGSFQKALQLYEEIHQQYPDNLECLRYLVAICRDLGQRYDQYEEKLHKLERGAAARQQATTGNGNGGGALTRMGGAQNQDRSQAPPTNQSRRPVKQQQYSDELPPPKVMAPPQQRNNQPSTVNNMRQERNDVDDFNDADVEDLLPV
jgi:intraflagellar transport protein 88